jgi:hypothetical protein
MCKLSNRSFQARNQVCALVLLLFETLFAVFRLQSDNAVIVKSLALMQKEHNAVYHNFANLQLLATYVGLPSI